MIEQILLADRHLQVDQVDRARDIYQRVVDADPGNAIAVVGLAQCALADGDDRRAHELATQALEIDPENDMARRMEARLSEVMVTRGEAIERPDAAATPAPREMRQVVTEGPIEPAAATPQPAATTIQPVTTTPVSATMPVPATMPEPVAPKPPDRTPVTTTPVPATTPVSATMPEPVAPKPPDRTPVKPPAAAKEHPVRKSFIDRLMGR